MPVDVVILAAGSEISAVAIFEELTANLLQVAVIALSDHGLLAAACPKARYAVIDWPPVSASDCAEAIRQQLVHWGASPQQPVVIFPTEDGGLRLLLDYQHWFRPLAHFSSTPKLMMAGLDKAEFCQFLQAQQRQHEIPTTLIITEPTEVMAAVASIGPAIVKPALKPLSMQLTGMPSKAFRSADFVDTTALCQALTACWSLSERWLVQQELQPLATADIAVYAIRSNHFYYAMLAEVRCRYPANTGTGCWVQILEAPAHPAFAQAASLLECIDFHGICEIEFMQDQAGKLKVVELNPRPWLQVGITTSAGVPLLTASYQLLQGQTIFALPQAAPVSWLCPERCLQAVLSSSSRWRTWQQLWSAFLSAKTYSIYSSKLTGVKRRWLQRLCRQLAGKQKRIG